MKLNQIPRREGSKRCLLLQSMMKISVNTDVLEFYGYDQNNINKILVLKKIEIVQNS